MQPPQTSLPERHAIVLESCGSDAEEPVVCPTNTTEAALIRSVDFRLLPTLTTLYLMAFLDRVNISNALTLGLPAELGLKGNQVNIALTVFFVPYIIFEIPSNILLKHFSPHVWLSGCMFVFGIITISQGFVQNYQGLIATRFFLGFAEAGIFPGSFYLLSMWYKREESQRRFSIYFGSATLAGAFGSLLASAIENMNGLRGYSGWRWIFILEGIATCIIAMMGYFLIPDFPEDVKWMSVEARIFMQKRLTENDKYTKPTSSLAESVMFLKDVKNYLGFLMYFGITMPAYGFAYFVPTIVKGYGYGPIKTQLYSVPPQAAAWALSILIAFLSDKTRLRAPFLAFCFAVAMSGIGILLNVHHNLPVRYAGIMLVAMGTYSSMPLIICWYTMNLHGSFERRVGTGWQIGLGNAGAIVATFSFLSKDAPYYHRGYSILMAGLCISATSATLYFLFLWWSNSREPAISEHRGEESDARLQPTKYLL